MAKGGRRPGAGRPKDRKNNLTEEQKATLTQLAVDASPAAFETLIEICGDAKATASARVSAANSIIDRALGKPAQSLDLDGPAMDDMAAALAEGRKALANVSPRLTGQP